MSPTVFKFSNLPIYDHVFSADGTVLAITSETDVLIYNVANPKQPRLLATLRDHDKTVTAVDMSIHGRIVTCSQDRNAIVWEPLSDGSYKPTLVLLRINRAATCVKWSPNGYKFAVGSGARAIAVCYFEQENDWWISKHIKKPIRSTIVSLNWHPNNVLLCCGSTDGHARVFSGYIKGIDSKPEPSVWGEKLPFQTLVGDYKSEFGGWVSDIVFNHDGNVLAFVANDGTVNVVYPELAQCFSVSTKYLPFTSVIFKTGSSSELVVAGNDCHPVVFRGDASQGWAEAYAIDDPAKSQAHAETETTAINMFKQLDLKGAVSKNSTDLKTVHQNTITCLRNHGSTAFSSSGIDGRVVVFEY